MKKRKETDETKPQAADTSEISTPQKVGAENEQTMKSATRAKGAPVGSGQGDAAKEPASRPKPEAAPVRRRRRASDEALSDADKDAPAKLRDPLAARRRKGDSADSKTSKAGQPLHEGTAAVGDPPSPRRSFRASDLSALERNQGEEATSLLISPGGKPLEREIKDEEAVVLPSEQWLTDNDLHLFNEGTHYSLYEKLGAHRIDDAGEATTHFAVWAPAARYVSVVGDFNEWDSAAHPLTLRAQSGIWHASFPDVPKGALYKFFIHSRFNDYQVAKTDPFGYLQQVPPQTASVVWDLGYEWGDSAWLAARREKQSLQQPVSIYEVHLGSWRRVPEEEDRSMTYREIAAPLADYVRELGFTHVELLPLMEHPFFGSWGYQSTGYFASTSRFGTPQDLMYLIDYLHQRDIGVIFDWVPSHFPTDEHGLGYFDGTHLFEHADPRQGFHPDWSSLIFNYGRNEVRSFLISSAFFWLHKYHVDGIRVDAVASMLYLDYSRKAGEWIPNEYGGRDNLEALGFLRRLNEDVYKVFPDVLMIAEESTSWPMVSRPTYLGGLGFELKWDMGWMHDTLRYFSHEPVYRKFHHNELTFRSMYAYSENFILPLSHDEVVHGKGSLIRKMQGDEWQRFANLRLLFSYMFAQPGKKLLFMGGEFAQWREWNHDASLDWHLLDDPMHHGVQRLVSDLNRIYRDYPAMSELDLDPAGFEWIDANDSEQSVLSFMRHDRSGAQSLVALFNFTPIIRHNYRVGIPHSGMWTEVFNSDAGEYGGSGQGNLGQLESAPIPYHGRRHSLNVTLPPVGAIFLVHS